MLPLPIDAHIDEVLRAVRRVRAAVVVAAPGAGKTTRVPPALTADGPVILLQPRRVAARAIATRIAAERGWTLGREVGWQVRFDRRFTRETALLVVTEGILTARLQTDPLLSDFRTIVLDEFHERSVHADLAIALARQAWRAREDLRIVVMSATLDAAAVSAFLDGAPVIDVPGRAHPIDVRYAAKQPVAQAVVDVLGQTAGDVLCFLAGAGEIRTAIAEIGRLIDASIDLVPLHGSLDSGDQDRALSADAHGPRRVVVATNIAETSVTVPRVTAVVDTGLHKVARYDSDRGIDSLETERITADAADQRAGRAGRIAPGLVRRLWDPLDRLRPHREPEIHRIDLAGTVLDVIAWGGDPRTLEWFEPPREDRIAAAMTLLERLGLIASGSPRLTDTGKQVHRLPLHPRLARMLVASGGAQSVARACALLSERHLLPPRRATTSSDLLSAIDDWHQVPPHVHRAADLIERLARSACGPGSLAIDETGFLRAVLAGYPERVAQRRKPGSADVLLATGTGATIARESGVREGEFLVAVDVHGTTGPASAARPSLPLIRIASRVEREWLQPTRSETVHAFDAASGRVKAVTVDGYDALVLVERPAPVDRDIAAQLLADARRERGFDEDDERLLRRLRFAGREIDVDDLLRLAASAARSIDDVRLAGALPADLARELDRAAPETLEVPSGRRVRLEYQSDGTVSASVKLQEVFGLAETPRIGRRREPVLLALLSPGGRPVQMTRDLRSFWDRTYPEVRKELRGRYPKHPWPDNPWTAPPTAKLKSKNSKVKTKTPKS